MMVVVAYDVNTQEASGRRRLRLVARECMKFGQRVQNSVFECVVSPSDKLLLEDSLLGIIDIDTDSLIFYNLGARYSSRIEQFGLRRHLPVDEVMMI